MFSVFLCYGSLFQRKNTPNNDLCSIYPASPVPPQNSALSFISSSTSTTPVNFQRSIAYNLKKKSWRIIYLQRRTQRRYTYTVIFECVVYILYIYIYHMYSPITYIIKGQRDFLFRSSCVHSMYCATKLNRFAVSGEFTRAMWNYGISYGS